MSVATAVALLCRFYGFSIDEVMGMTLRVYGEMLQQVSVILIMEYGGEGDTPNEKGLTGNAGFNLARTFLPKGNRNG